VDDLKPYTPGFKAYRTYAVELETMSGKDLTV